MTATEPAIHLSVPNDEPLRVDPPESPAGLLDGELAQSPSDVSMARSVDVRTSNQQIDEESCRHVEHWPNVRRMAAASDTMRKRLAQRAHDARVKLRPLAKCPTPERSPARDCVNSYVMVWCWRPCVSPCMEAVAARVKELGGPAEVRFLLSAAKVDMSGHGEVDHLELQLYESEGEVYLQGVRTMCDNAAVVCSLMLGLTHLVTIGRPVPFQLANEATYPHGWHDESYVSADVLQALLWVAYACNVASEAAALGTLVLAFATRSILLTILPTLEAKVEWISQIKPMLLQTRGINLVFITFSLSMALCALVASATFSWIAVGIVFLSSQVSACLMIGS